MTETFTRLDSVSKIRKLKVLPRLHAGAHVSTQDPVANLSPLQLSCKTKKGERVGAERQPHHLTALKAMLHQHLEQLIGFDEHVPDMKVARKDASPGPILAE